MEVEYDSLGDKEILSVEDIFVIDRFCKRYDSQAPTLRICKYCRYVRVNHHLHMIVAVDDPGYHKHISCIKGHIFTSCCSGKTYSVMDMNSKIPSHEEYFKGIFKH